MKRFSKADYLKNKDEALALAVERVDFFNSVYQFSYNSVSVRNQRTCWGSCSELRNLNFNYKILYLPAILIDYIIVHELCHLEELNHSNRFWALVAHTVPNYKEAKKRLLDL